MIYKKWLLRVTAVSAASLYLYVALTPSNPGTASTNPQRVGLLIVATGKYVQFVQPLIRSAEQFFLPGHERTYFIFTDHIDELQKQANIVPVFQKKLGWPYDSMMRSSIYNDHRELFNNMDYLFACDADMVFVDYVGNEVLGNLVATLHPIYTWRRGTYDANPKSKAYVAAHEGTHYFAGGFYGGSRDAFCQMIQELTQNIKSDTSNGIMARWHDESHLNRYFIDHEPTCILNPSYCYPEGYSFGYHPRLVALYKNHAYWRA